MAHPTKVICICKGNSDRSPMMAEVLDMYLKNAGIKGVAVSSAGVLEVAKNGTAAEFAIVAGKRIGLDLTSHRRRWFNELPDKAGYDLYICVDDEVAGLVMGQGVNLKKIANANTPNPWPCQRQHQYDKTMGRIMTAMYEVVTDYFSFEE